MRILYLVPFVLAVILLPGEAWAGSHGAPARDLLIGLGAPESVALVVAAAYDNVAHVFIHLSMTWQVLSTSSDLGSAILMLDQIGQACFSESPPWAHMLFQNGLLAIATLMIALLACLEVLVRIFYVTFNRARAPVAVASPA